MQRRTRERERERERMRETSVNLRCYYFAADSYILKSKEALLVVADMKKRDELIYNSRMEIHLFVLFWANIQKSKAQALYY